MKKMGSGIKTKKETMDNQKMISEKWETFLSDPTGRGIFHKIEMENIYSKRKKIQIVNNPQSPFNGSDCSEHGSDGNDKIKEMI